MKALYIFLFISVTALGQNTLLFEDFNAGWPAGWVKYDGDSLTPNALVSFVDEAWIIVEDADSTGIGDSCALSNSWYDPVGESEDIFVLSQITLGTSGNYLEWEAKSEDPAFPDSYEIHISTTGNAYSDFQDSAFYTVTDESPYWNFHKIALDSFASQTINIAFKNVSNNKYLLMVDNIRVVENDPMSVEEYNLNVQSYPNPARDLVTFSRVSTGNAQFINMLGQTTPLAVLNGQAAISGLSPGTYFVQIIDESGRRALSRVVIF